MPCGLIIGIILLSEMAKSKDSGVILFFQYKEQAVDTNVVRLVRGVRISFSWGGGGVVSKLDRFTD